jgi:hypothetical protein
MSGQDASGFSDAPFDWVQAIATVAEMGGANVLASRD